MESNRLVLFGILLLSNAVLASQDFLPEITKKDQEESRPYVESVISSSDSADGVTAFTESCFPKSFSVVGLCNPTTGEKLQVRIGSSDVYSIALSKDGKIALTGLADCTAVLLDTATWRHFKVLEGHKGPVRSVALSEDGKTALTGSDDNTAILWNTETGQRLKVLEGHKGRVRSVALSIDEKTARIGLDDGTAILWNITTGEKLPVLVKGDKDYVSPVVLSDDDGKVVLTGSYDKTAVALSADGKIVLTESYDETAYVKSVISSSELPKKAELFNTIENSLPEIIKKDQELRSYVKNVISSSELPKKAELFSTIESPILFKELNFKELLKGMFGEKVWVPHAYEFRNVVLQKVFQPYSPKLPASEVESEAEIVFLANILYRAGSMLYDETGNYTHLEHAASLGHANAQLKMFSVDFKLRNLEKAKNYLFCSAAQGNLQALNQLSSVYEGYWGIGVSRDLDIAKLLCQEASELGHPEAKFMIKVASFTEGTFGSKKDFQKGVRKAKKLADKGNQRAKEFLEGIMMSSADALQEANDDVTDKDLDFLRTELGWKDEWEQ